MDGDGCLPGFHIGSHTYKLTFMECTKSMNLQWNKKLEITDINMTMCTLYYCQSNHPTSSPSRVGQYTIYMFRAF